MANRPARGTDSQEAESPPRREFAELLAAFRTARGLSQSALAQRVGADASYINRIERGERDAPKRDLVEKLAAALDLSKADADRLLVAAGHLPQAIARLTPLDPTLCAVADLLADETLPPQEIVEFRGVVEAIARRWRRS